MDGNPISFNDSAGNNKALEWLIRKIVENVTKKVDLDRNDLEKRAIDQAYKSQRDALIGAGVDPNSAQQQYEARRDQAFKDIDADKRNFVQRYRDAGEVVWDRVRQRWFTPESPKMQPEDPGATPTICPL